MAEVITIRILGMGTALRQLDRMGEFTVKGARKALRTVTPLYMRALVQHAPGEVLKKEIGTRIEDTETGAVARIFAPFQLLFTLPPGTRPHEIRPRPPRRALRFFWERVGETVFFARVRHPGYAGDPWRDRAIQQVRPQAIGLLARAGATVIEQ